MHAFAARKPPLADSPEGVVRVSGTRVPLEAIVVAFDAGATPEEIAQQYPTVELAVVYAVVAYVLENRAWADSYVASRRQASAAVRGEIERRWPPQGVRARLLARRPATAPR